MAGDEDTSETNYFKRLRGILKLDGYDDPRLRGNLARPKGMKAGAEEPLWKTWNHWLIDQGFIPTAKAGNGNKKFINYPISQCLLRQADRDRLEKHFYEQGWMASWDDQTLFSRLRENTHQFPEYLRNLLKESGDRYEVLMNDVHEVHQEWLAAGCPEPSNNKKQRRQISSNLFAGLYRSEEDREIEYYLYPKQNTRQLWDRITVQLPNEKQELKGDRPGWYLPIGSPLTASNLEQGIRYPIIHPDPLKTLQLPARDFWLLIADPDDPDTGVYGSWRTPELGQPFILLCKEILMQDLHRLRDEKLVEWSDEIKPFQGLNHTWLELQQFMVLSQAWQNIFIENWELKDLLRPKVSLSLSFSGGLRAPNQKGWLLGNPPKVTAFGFMPSVDLQVLKLPDEVVITNHIGFSTNKPWDLDLAETGSYLIRATSRSKVAERFIRVIAWEDLELNLNPRQELVKISNKFLSGATLI